MSNTESEKHDDLPQLALLLEQGGSISIGKDRRKNPHYYEQVRIAAKPEALAPLKLRFGGSISTNGHRGGVVWRATANVARKFFMAVKPFVVKRLVEVDAVITFGKIRQESAETGGSGGMAKVAGSTRAILEIERRRRSESN